MWCWTTSAVAHSANWMQSVAVPFLVYEMTGSHALLGVAALAGQAPALLASPLGGLWADRYSPKKILLATLAVKACVALSFFALHRSELLSLPWIFGLLAIGGFASTANIAVWQPFVAQIVSDRSLAAAYRLNAMQFNFSRAVGPALAGAIGNRRC